MPGLRNEHAARSLEEVAVIMYERGLIPKPSKQNVAAYEASAFRKIRAAMPELVDELLAEQRLEDTREERRARWAPELAR